MSNMSYCRWQNTLSDLRDCAHYLNNKLSVDESRARQRVLELCVSMLEGCENVTVETDGAEIVVKEYDDEDGEGY